MTHPDQTVRVPSPADEELALSSVLRSRGRKNSSFDINRAANLLELLALQAAAPSPEAGLTDAVVRVPAVAAGALIPQVYGGEWCLDPAIEFRADLIKVLASLQRPQTPPMLPGVETLGPSAAFGANVRTDSGLVDRLVDALEFYGREWEWYPGDGEAPDATHPGSAPTFYEADPTARLKDDAGQIAREALAQARKGAA